MTYSKTIWVDDQEPSINAANLNKMEQGIAAADEVYIGTVEPTDPSIDWWIDTSVAGGSGPASYTIQDEGVPLIARAAMNFIGTGVTVTDDLANNRTNVDITGGGGGGGITSVNGDVGPVIVLDAAEVGAAPTVHTHVKADVGLSNVDNTSDANKPVSSATQTALNLKANNATTVTTTAPITGSGTLGANLTLGLATDGVLNTHLANMAASTFKGNNTGSAADPIDMTVAQAKTLLALVKADVGLGSVDNTADTAKPVSTTQQTALNLKADITYVDTQVNTRMTQTLADTLYIGKTGAQTMTGILTLDSAGTASMVLDRGATTNYAQFEFRTAGVQKWAVGTRNGEGEDFSIFGTAQRALRIDATTYLATVYGDPTDVLGIATKQYVDAHTPKITVASTAPSSPAVGDLWVDTT